MNSHEAKTALAKLCLQATAIADTAKTAQRNRKSLRGDNHYGHKFHDGLTAMSSTLARVQPLLSKLSAPEAVVALEAVNRGCETLKSFDADNKTRMMAVKAIEHACNATLNHALDSMHMPAVPATEQVLPMAVVHDTESYLVQMILQANGCFERGWFDASAVMIRKFVETLIIHVYEHHKRADEIKSPRTGNFLMLADLVDFILADKAFNLGRESKSTLPIVKLLGDRSAHVRRYLANRSDILKVIPGLRVIADDLLHLGGLK